MKATKNLFFHVSNRVADNSPAGEVGLERILSCFLTSEDSELAEKLKKKVCRDFLKWRIQNQKSECEYFDLRVVEKKRMATLPNFAFNFDIYNMEA